MIRTKLACTNEIYIDFKYFTISVIWTNNEYPFLRPHFSNQNTIEAKYSPLDGAGCTLPAFSQQCRPCEQANDVYNINLDFNFVSFTSLVISKFAVIGACPKFKLNTR